MLRPLRRWRRTRPSLPAEVVFFFLGLLPLDDISAQTRVWVGGTGDWNTAENWLPQGGPTFSEDAEIGNGGTAQLMDNGSVKNLYLGFTSGSGRLEVSNGGLLTSEAVAVGTLGTGTLYLSTGGDVDSLGESVVGLGITSQGEVLISGTGSEWFNDGDLLIGDAGHATLTIESGGKLTNAKGLVANHASSVTTISVQGPGSTWNNTEYLDVGVAGTATMTIAGGGTVSSFHTFDPEFVFSSVAREADSAGTVNITGEFSKWEATGLDIGVLGTATVTLTFGGDLVTGFATIQAGAAPVSVTSKVFVDGVGSTWTASDVTVGGSGQGELSVTNGGQVHIDGDFANLSIGGTATGKGLVTVDGLGSELIVDQQLDVGFFGVGELKILNNGAVVSDYGDSGSGTITIKGAQSKWTVTHSIGISNGTMTISDGGKLYTNETNPNVGSSIGVGLGNTGHVIVTLSNSAWFNPTAQLYVGISEGHGILDILHGGDVTSGEGIIGQQATGTVTVDESDSTWTVTGGLGVGNDAAGPAFGTLLIQNGGTVSSGTGRIGAGLVKVGTDSAWNMTGELQIGLGGSGTLETFTNGIVTAGGGTTVRTNGTLQGLGTLNSSVTNEGIVRPGTSLSLGTLHIGGNYSQFSNGKLEIELAAATLFDKLAMTGTAGVDGILNVVLVGGYMPLATDTFEIVVGSSRIGTFTSVNVTAGSLPAGTFNVVYTATSVLLTNFSPVDLPGDHNHNGVVDAADYVAWRNDQANHGGASGYNTWRTNFGRTSGGGGGALSPGAAVPEPASIVLVVSAMVAAFCRRGRSARQRTGCCGMTG